MLFLGEDISLRLFSLTSLNGANGFVVNGISNNDQLGSSVSIVGDMNGDGKDDLVLTANAFSNYVGAAYAIFINLPPLVNQIIPDRSIQSGISFNFSISDTFIDPDGDNLTYSARQTDGSSLPIWLSFDSENCFFSGITSFPSTTSVIVEAKDTGNLVTGANFTLSAIEPTSSLGAIIVGGVVGSTILTVQTNDRKDHPEKSWHLDHQLKAQTVDGDKIYELLEATEQDKRKVIEFYQHCPVSGYIELKCCIIR